MSFEINKDGSYVFYLNFRTIGNGRIEATAEQNFTFSHLIEDASKYSLSIERFRLPIQSIPMRPAINNAIILRSKLGAADIFISTNPTFSLYEWLLQLNGAAAPLVISLTADGRITILNFDFNAFSIELSPVVQSIFDMEAAIDGIGVQTSIGGTVIYDRFDQLFKIQIEGLNGLGAVQQEIVDTNIFTTVLTDFIVPSDFTTSVTNTIGQPINNTLTFSFPARQDLEFNASNARRLIMFRGSSPIQNVKVRVTAIFRDGSRNAIILAPESIFEMKLAFFKKGTKGST